MKSPSPKSPKGRNKKASVKTTTSDPSLENLKIRHLPVSVPAQKWSGASLASPMEAALNAVAGIDEEERMVLDMMGFEMRWRLPASIRWLDYLHSYWDEGRTEDWLPLADELFLGDLVEPMPHLLLAYHDVDGDAYRIEFAGAAARAELVWPTGGGVAPAGPASGGDLVGVRPELVEPGSALSWIGAGYASARRIVLPGAVHVRNGDLLALHLPYVDHDGRISVILSAIARWPEARLSGTQDQRRTGDADNVVPFTPKAAPRRTGRR
jgi:hypothetical protein